MINYFIVGSVPTTTLSTILFVSVSFLLLMLLIKKFAWGPITKVLDERAEKIANEIDESEKAKEEALKLKETLSVQLVEAKAEAAALVKAAKEKAEQSSEEIVKAAEREVEKNRSEAQQKIKLEREELMESARIEVADLSLQIASKILKKELDAATHQSLINTYIEELRIDV